MNSVSSALVEYSSEFTGGAFTLLGQGAKTALIKAGFMKAVIKANPSITPSMFSQVIQKAGWHGVLPEFGEERVADAMYAVLNELGLSDQTFQISWKQVADEIAAFAIMGSAIRGVDKALGRITTGGKQDQEPDPVDTLVSDVRAQMDTGASPTEVALSLSQEMPTSAAEAIVKEAVLEGYEATRQPQFERSTEPGMEGKMGVVPTGEGAKKQTKTSPLFR